MNVIKDNRFNARTEDLEVYRKGMKPLWSVIDHFSYSLIFEHLVNLALTFHTYIFTCTKLGVCLSNSITLRTIRASRFRLSFGSSTPFRIWAFGILVFLEFRVSVCSSTDFGKKPSHWSIWDFDLFWSGKLIGFLLQVVGQVGSVIE